jgi:3-methylcrotonyl-CoA carboxylase alpha subunit
MSTDTVVTRIADGVYRVETGGRAHVVHVAGTASNLWLHWNGRVYHRPYADAPRAATGASAGPHALGAPMPATVLKVLVHPGAAVHTGDTLLILEAMKMELPLKATADAVVRTVLCREGELVQPGTPLVELE